MNDFLATSFAAWLSIAMVALGIGAAVVLATATEGSPLRIIWSKYVRLVDEEVRFLLLRRSGAEIARIQALVVCGLLAVFAFTGNLLFLAGAILSCVLPLLKLRGDRTKKVERLEVLLDGWLLLLANSLKATPAIGEAIRSTVNLVQPPMSDELDLLVKENQLGTPLDQAILNASERIGSPIVSGSLAMLVVARQTGGDLPTILETSAGSLREMARLEGVVRTKTAEGKGQVLVLGVLPWGMAGMLAFLDESWWPSLVGNFIGNIMLLAAGACWLVAVLWGRNILSVDI